MLFCVVISYNLMRVQYIFVISWIFLFFFLTMGSENIMITCDPDLPHCIGNHMDERSWDMEQIIIIIIIIIKQQNHQGSVVQSIVSLTSSLVVKILTVLVSASSDYRCFAEKLWVAFAMQKLLTFSSAKILTYMPYLLFKVLMVSWLTTLLVLNNWAQNFKDRFREHNISNCNNRRTNRSWTVRDEPPRNVRQKRKKERKKKILVLLDWNLALNSGVAQNYKHVPPRMDQRLPC